MVSKSKVVRMVSGTLEELDGAAVVVDGTRYQLSRWPESPGIAQPPIGAHVTLGLDRDEFARWLQPAASDPWDQLGPAPAPAPSAKTSPQASPVVPQASTAPVADSRREQLIARESAVRAAVQLVAGQPWAHELTPTALAEAAVEAASVLELWICR